jgi:hypothetical protein
MPSPSSSRVDGQDGPVSAAVASVDEDEVMKTEIDDARRSLHGACQHYKYQLWMTVTLCSLNFTSSLDLLFLVVIIHVYTSTS